MVACERLLVEDLGEMTQVGQVAPPPDHAEDAGTPERPRWPPRARPVCRATPTRPIDAVGSPSPRSPGLHRRRDRRFRGRRRTSGAAARTRQGRLGDSIASRRVSHSVAAGEWKTLSSAPRTAGTSMSRSAFRTKAVGLRWNRGPRRGPVGGRPSNVAPASNSRLISAAASAARARRVPDSHLVVRAEPELPAKATRSRHGSWTGAPARRHVVRMWTHRVDDDVRVAERHAAERRVEGQHERGSDRRFVPSVSWWSRPSGGR